MLTEGGDSPATEEGIWVVSYKIKTAMPPDPAVTLPRMYSD